MGFVVTRITAVRCSPAGADRSWFSADSIKTEGNSALRHLTYQPSATIPVTGNKPLSNRKADSSDVASGCIWLHPHLLINHTPGELKDIDGLLMVWKVWGGTWRHEAGPFRTLCLISPAAPAAGSLNFDNFGDNSSFGISVASD